MGFWHIYFGLYGGGGTQPNPDFMRGVLRMVPHLSGEIKAMPAVCGEAKISVAVSGKVEVNP